MRLYSSLLALQLQVEMFSGLLTRLLLLPDSESFLTVNLGFSNYEFGTSSEFVGYLESLLLHTVF